MIVQFDVIGVPQPQGSKVITRHGGMREANKLTMPWRQDVAWRANQAMGTFRKLLVGDKIEPLTCAVAVEIVLRFPRPKSHFGTGRNAGVVKPSAPLYVSKKPDIDKCARAILDAITGIVIRDDAQVALLHVAKSYGQPGALVTVRVLTDNTFVRNGGTAR